jgi:hypothetical protein
MKGRRQVKEGLLSLATAETWTVYVYHSEGEWARQKIEVPLNGYVGARRTGLSVLELQRCLVFNTQQFPVCIKNGSPPKGHPVN